MSHYNIHNKRNVTEEHMAQRKCMTSHVLTINRTNTSTWQTRHCDISKKNLSSIHWIEM